MRRTSALNSQGLSHGQMGQSDRSPGRAKITVSKARKRPILKAHADPTLCPNPLSPCLAPSPENYVVITGSHLTRQFPEAEDPLKHSLHVPWQICQVTAFHILVEFHRVNRGCREGRKGRYLDGAAAYGRCLTGSSAPREGKSSSAILLAARASFHTSSIPRALRAPQPSPPSFLLPRQDQSHVYTHGTETWN